MDLTARAAELCGTRPGEPLLDVGCGSGGLPLRLGRGLGVDLRSGRPRADARALPFPDRSFGVAGCLLVLHYLRKTHLALAELRRVLRPGGLLVLADRVASPDPSTRALQDRLERLRNPTIGALLPEAGLRGAVEAAGFHVRSAEPVELRTNVEAWCRGDGSLRAALENSPKDLGGLRREPGGALVFRASLLEAYRPDPSEASTDTATIQSISNASPAVRVSTESTRSTVTTRLRPDESRTGADSETP